MAPSSVRDGSADKDERGPIVTAVCEVAKPMTVRAAWLLSTAVSLERHDFEDLLSGLWSEEAGHAEAALEILEWPFVEETVDGYRMSESSAHAFRRNFLAEDEFRFRQAHQMLAELERSRDAGDDADRAWFGRGRYAFYLAGYDQEGAAQIFGDNFADPPLLNPTSARMWLSWLAIQQSDLLGEVPRVIEFFHGFRSYVKGAYREARRSFDSVVSAGEPDAYHALATHFAGLLRRGDEPARGQELLRGSVQLSGELELVENEIMARNSLVTALISDRSVSDLGEAAELSRLNLERALLTENPHLIYWCRTTFALGQWAYLTDRHSRVGDEAREAAPELVRELESVVTEAFSTEVETALQAANMGASILRDVGSYSASLELLDRVTSRLPEIEALPPQPLERLTKTTRSLRKHLSKEQLALASEVSARLQAEAERTTSGAGPDRR